MTSVPTDRTRRSRLLLPGLVTMLLLACASTAPPAHAYVLGGQRWPGKVITVYDGGPNKAAVKTAIRTWNASGVRVRFRTASKRRAKVVISGYGPTRCSGVLGVAQLGYAPGRQARVRLARCGDAWIAATAAVHELGHILGLSHERKRCAVMQASPPGGCSQTPPYYARCRLLERDDVRGAVRRYGGKVKAVRANPFCALYTPPTTDQLAITGVAPDPTGARVISASFRSLVGAKLKPTTYPAPWLRVSVYRYAGACLPGAPTGTPVAEQTVTGGAVTQLQLEDRLSLAPGRYCYALWTTDAAGRRATAPATALVDVSRQAPVAAFSAAPSTASVDDPIFFDDTSNAGEARQLTWSWNFGDPAAADNTSTTANPVHAYPRAGTYTVTLTVTDEIGQASTTTRTVRVDP